MPAHSPKDKKENAYVMEELFLVTSLSAVEVCFVDLEIVSMADIERWSIEVRQCWVLIGVLS